MEYEDRKLVATAEGVELRLQLAGLGSRFAAALIDALIKGAAILVLVIVAALVGGGIAEAVLVAVGVFLALIVFDVVFEVRGGGRTPGKRALGLRVVRTDGSAIGLRASAVRNVLRLVDGLPLSYVPGVVSILLTRDNQRLGDLAAGTVVVHEHTDPGYASFTVPASAREALAGWDVSAVTQDELAAVRSFLARRYSFEAGPRATVAARLAERIAPRVSGAPEGIAPERFLESVANAKSLRG